jgi:proteasome beta subunit
LDILQRQPPFFPGATTVGSLCKEGIILASEKRVSYGYLVMSKAAKKVFKITDKIGAACAGLVSDMQVLVNEVGAYANLLMLEMKRPVGARTVAKLMSNLLFRRRLFPLITQTIIGGFDDENPGVYVLDPLGSLIKDRYTCVGSGAEIAIGIFESEYREDLNLDELKDLVVRAIKSAISRDAMSGNGIDLLIISESGTKEESIPL